LAALGLEENKGNGKQEREIVGVYDYRGWDGELVFQVVRFADKQFRQRRPNGSGWVWNLHDVVRVPYRLPDVMRAPEDRIIVVAEGEKDADRLWVHGLVATCSVGGAGKWKQVEKDARKLLAGRTVAVIPDNDDPGRKHAEDVKRSLTGVAKLVAICELPGLPEKGDVSDFLDQHSTEELAGLIDAAVAAAGPKLRAVCLADVSIQRTTWLWDGWIPNGKISIIEGDPGGGKSTLTLDLAARLSTGSPMPHGDGPQAQPRATCILSAEDDHRETMPLRLLAAGADLRYVHTLLSVSIDGVEHPIAIPRDIDAIESWIRLHDPALLVIDPLNAYLQGVDSHKDQDIRVCLARMAKMAQDTRVAVLIVRHLVKANVRAIHRGGGSMGIIGAARSGMVLAKNPDDESIRVLASVKNNLAPAPRSLAFRFESGADASRIVCTGFDRHGADDLMGERMEQPITEAMAFLRSELADGPKSVAELMRESRKAGISDMTLRRAKAELRVMAQKSSFSGDWRWGMPDE
jgi:hypothetical protein